MQKDARWRQLPAAGAGILLPVYAATTFLSALLLFALQPMFAKMVLPVLGGSPSVWAVAIFFYQAALLAGYCNPHLLIAKATPQQGGTVHSAVCLAAFSLLQIGLVPRRGRQTWFARSGYAHASDPYFLYVASNLGSLTALLSYPFVLEPEFGRKLATGGAAFVTSAMVAHRTLTM